jgi:hypothetical protein
MVVAKGDVREPGAFQDGGYFSRSLKRKKQQQGTYNNPKTDSKPYLNLTLTLTVNKSEL